MQRTKRAKKPEFTTVYSDGQGGEIRYHFALENLEALLDGQRVGFPRCEVDGMEMIAQAMAARAGVRLN
jgi:hypothetical protein